MTMMAIAIAAAVLAGPADTRMLQAQLTLAEARNKALQNTVTRLRNQNIWLTDEVARLKQIIEKLEAKAAKTASRPDEPEAVDPNTPKKLLLPAGLAQPTFRSLGAIAKAYPPELLPKGTERSGGKSAQSKVMDWFRKEVRGKTVVVSAKVRSVELPGPGKAGQPQIIAAAPTMEITVAGRKCSWEFSFIDAKLSRRDVKAIGPIRTGEEVTIYGKVTGGMITIRRVMTRRDKLTFYARVLLSMTNCKLIRIGPGQ